MVKRVWLTAVVEVMGPADRLADALRGQLTALPGLVKVHGLEAVEADEGSDEQGCSPKSEGA